MNVALWIGQILLATLGLSGLFKAFAPIPTLSEKLGKWAGDFPPPLVRFIGWAEVAAMLGLILPPLTGIATFLTPLAAVGVALIMIGAAITHAKYREFGSIGANVFLFAVAVFVAWGRFGEWAF